MKRLLVRRAGPCAALLLVAALCLPALVGTAAEEEKPLGTLPSDLALVPRDASGFATLRVPDLVKQPLLLQLLGLLSRSDSPLDQLRQMSGLDPAGIERVTAVFHSPEGQPLLVLKTRKPYDRAALLRHLGDLEEQKIGNRTILTRKLPPKTKDRFDPRGRRADPDALWPADATTLVLGPRSRVAARAAAPAGTTHVLGDELKLAAGKHSLVVGLRPGLLLQRADAEDRRRREEWRERRLKGKDRGVKDKGFPARDVESDRDAKGGAAPKEPKLRDLEAIFAEMGLEGLTVKPFARASRMLLTADLGGELRAAVRLHYASENHARDGALGVAVVLYAMREGLRPALCGAGLDPADRGLAPMLDRVEAALRATTPKRDGKAVSASVQVKLEALGLAKLLAEKALHLRDANNLKQLGLALHNYHDVFGHLPPPAITSKDGKALLSWRVAILPFVEEDNLYRQFKLDEPWDSPHNKKLLDRRPKVYAPVVETGPEPSGTCYQLFTGPNTPFRTLDAKTRFAHFRDGLSNTILVAEASKAVPWTKPEDLVIEPKKPLPRLGGQFKGFFHVLFGDGSVRPCRRTIDERTLRLFIDPADGQVVDHDKLKP